MKHGVVLGRLTATSHSGDVVVLRELGHLLIEFADPVPDKPFIQSRKSYETLCMLFDTCGFFQQASSLILIPVA